MRSKKRYTLVNGGTELDAPRVVVEAKYGNEWRVIAEFDNVEAATAAFPEARERGMKGRS